MQKLPFQALTQDEIAYIAQIQKHYEWYEPQYAIIQRWIMEYIHQNRNNSQKILNDLKEAWSETENERRIWDTFMDLLKQSEV